MKKHVRRHILSLIIPAMSIFFPIGTGGQEVDQIDINLSIESRFSIHNASDRLEFPHCTCPPDTLLVTLEPYLFTVETNSMGVYLTFQCVSPEGDLVRSLLKQKFLDTWYILTEEEEPPPEHDDPRWIPGKQLIGYIYPIMSIGTTDIRIFSKIRADLPESGLYRDLWSITIADGEVEDNIPMNVDCEVIN